jgi:hypothetical protein
MDFFIVNRQKPQSGFTLAKEAPEELRSWQKLFQSFTLAECCNR